MVDSSDEHRVERLAGPAADLAAVPRRLEPEEPFRPQREVLPAQSIEVRRPTKECWRDRNAAGQRVDLPAAVADPAVGAVSPDLLPVELGNANGLGLPARLTQR